MWSDSEGPSVPRGWDLGDQGDQGDLGRLDNTYLRGAACRGNNVEKNTKQVSWVLGWNQIRRDGKDRVV